MFRLASLLINITATLERQIFHGPNGDLSLVMEMGYLLYMDREKNDWYCQENQYLVHRYLTLPEVKTWRILMMVPRSSHIGGSKVYII